MRKMSEAEKAVHDRHEADKKLHAELAKKVKQDSDRYEAAVKEASEPEEPRLALDPPTE